MMPKATPSTGLRGTCSADFYMETRNVLLLIIQVTSIDCKMESQRSLNTVKVMKNEGLSSLLLKVCGKCKIRKPVMKRSEMLCKNRRISLESHRHSEAHIQGRIFATPRTPR
uniref:Uncharacterized protein n=1 Tax=Arundo donax TaxID=35708 RepID=A0A0A8ZA13_ARUDO